MIQGNTKSKIHLGAINGVFWRVLWKSKSSDKTGEYWKEWEEAIYRQHKKNICKRIIKRFLNCIK